MIATIPPTQRMALPRLRRLLRAKHRKCGSPVTERLEGQVTQVCLVGNNYSFLLWFAR